VREIGIWSLLAINRNLSRETSNKAYFSISFSRLFFYEVGQSRETNWNPWEFSREDEGERVKPSYRRYLEVVPLELFLDMMPSPRADILPRALRGWFRERCRAAWTFPTSIPGSPLLPLSLRQRRESLGSRLGLFTWVKFTSKHCLGFLNLVVIKNNFRPVWWINSLTYPLSSCNFKNMKPGL